ncbi:MAG: transcriptional repressor, partial [Neisseria sp.]
MNLSRKTGIRPSESNFMDTIKQKILEQ